MWCETYIICASKNMNNKKFIALSISTLACVVVLAAMVTGVNKNTVLNLVSSEPRVRTITMNKDTLVTRYSYNESGSLIGSYAYFQLDNPGSYTAFMSHTYFSSTLGGNHLYETSRFTETGCGVGFAVDIRGLRDSNYYFDENKTRKINYPGISSIRQIEITLSDENTAPFDESHITDYYRATLEHNPENPNVYIIKDIPSNITSLYAISFTTTEENLNQKLVVEQVRVSYYC